MKNKSSVAVLYIATGRYIVFWDYFYKSAENFLLPDCDKHYILFTDDNELNKNSSIYAYTTIIYQQALPWPYPTLKRYEFFLSIEQKIRQYDYTFYFNGNTEFLSPITCKDLLPNKRNEKLTLYLQPHVFHLKRNNFPYDRNLESSAYIPLNIGKYYFAGGIVGGVTENFLQLCQSINEKTESDLEKGIIALWHDESQLNKFALYRDDIKILPPYFTKGELEYWKNTSKIMFSDKCHPRFGGHDYLRGETDDKITNNKWGKQKIKKRKFFIFRVKQYFKSLFL